MAMKKSLLLGLAVLLLSATIMLAYATGGNPIEDLYAQVIQKMDEIKMAIQNQELDPTVNVENTIPVPEVTVENTINMPEVEPQPAYSVEEIRMQYSFGSDDWSETRFDAFAFPNGKEWSSITVTKLTFVGYISDHAGTSTLDGFIEINGAYAVFGTFVGWADADPSLVQAGTNYIRLWADTGCRLTLDRIIIEYQITPAN